MSNNRDNESWEIIDSKVLNEMRTELSSLRTELINFKEVVSDIKKRNNEIKVYLESNRVLYSKAIKDNYTLLENVQHILEENRKLYMNAFEQEKEKLDQLGKIASPDKLLREANMKWRNNSTLPSIRNTVMKFE